MIYKRYVLMNPGPVLVDRRVRKALTGADLCHREPEFAELMTSVRDKIRLVCEGDADYTSVLLMGSGTAALEAVLSSVIPESGKLLILSNGHYGERITEIARVHSISHREVKFGWAVSYSLDQVEAVLGSDSKITHVAMVHHETSTGMLNPLNDVGRLVSLFHRSLIVDAISSLGGELLNVRDDSVDWCIGTANKCIEGIPGVSFVCGSYAAFRALATVPNRTFYLDLHSNYVAQQARKAPLFTPAVQVMCALDVALDLLLKESVIARNARYGMLAEQLRHGLKIRGFEFLLQHEQDRSCLLTALRLPQDCSYADLHDRLKRRGFVVYAGQEALARSYFRLSTMGQITRADIDAFFNALDEARNEIRESIG